MSWIQIAHQIPGRTRMRSPALRRNHARCEQIADALSAIAGVREVAVRPYTGSVLVLHAREITADALIGDASRVLAVNVLGPGQQPPLPASVPPLSSIARKLVHVVQELDRDIRRRSEGSVDLGTLAALGFFGAGAAEVVATGRLPMPPWFNLAWWGFRTFVTTEQDEIAAEASNVR